MEVRKILPSPAGRGCGIDLVKTFAIFGVLLIHASPSALNRCELAFFSLFSALVWGNVSRASVPLFFMCP